MDNRPGRLEQLANLIMAALVVWLTLPEHQRTAVKMRAAATLRILAARWARKEGRAGMADELAGRDPRPRYVTAWRLVLLRDKVLKVSRDVLAG